MIWGYFRAVVLKQMCKKKQTPCRSLTVLIPDPSSPQISRLGSITPSL